MSPVAAFSAHMADYDYYNAISPDGIGKKLILFNEIPTFSILIRNSDKTMTVDKRKTNEVALHLLGQKTESKDFRFIN